MSKIIKLIEEDGAGDIKLVREIDWTHFANWSDPSIDRTSYDSHQSVEVSLNDSDREKIPPGWYLIALLIAQHHPKIPQDGSLETDIHFYRQDSDGGWSHKRGMLPVERLPAKSGLGWYEPTVPDLSLVQHRATDKDGDKEVRFVYRLRAYLCVRGNGVRISEREMVPTWKSDDSENDFRD